MAAGGRCGDAGRALPAALLLLLLLLLLGAAASPRSSSCHHRPPGRGEVRPGQAGRGQLRGWGWEEDGRGGKEGEAVPTAVLPAAGGVRRAPGRGSPRQEGRGAAAAD